MAKSLPPLTWFRSFEAAARHLSFTAAAQEIGLTQSAVSQQIKSLETRLGVVLFQRRPRGLALTDEGRRLLPQVGSAMETLASATREIDTGESGAMLTIVSSVSVAQWVIAPALASFSERHPGARLRFLTAVWPDEFNNARADVEIRFGSQKQVGRNAELLTPNALVPMKSPTLAGPFANLPRIEAVGTSAGWKAWGETFGQTIEPRYFVDSFGMALHMAAEGHGVALVSQLLTTHARRSGQLVRASDDEIPGTEGYYLSHDTAKPLAGAFREWLLNHLNPAGPSISHHAR